MTGRGLDEPWGAARFAYAYLAAVVSLLGAGLVGLIAYPIIGATGACGADTSGYCTPGTTGLVVVIALAGCLVLAARIVRLGWQWAAWTVVLILVVVQVMVWADRIWVGWLAVLVPALAVAITFRQPNRAPRRATSIGRFIALALVAAQFVVWLVELMVAP